MTDAVRRQSGPFRPGDRVQLTGPKGRLNTITLEVGGEFHTHTGILGHDLIIGQPDASVVVSNNGVEYLALRPLLTDFVMSMPRGAAIIYPKDAAQILGAADIFPGAVVVEAGVGSGALALWLLRAIGPAGSLHSFERRQEFADIAAANATAFLGATPENWTITVGDLVEALPTMVPDGTVDRVVLDMLAPWECVAVAAAALTPGRHTAVLRRDRDAALAHGRGDPGGGAVHRAGLLRDARAHLARRGSRRATRPQDDRTHRFSPRRPTARTGSPAARGGAPRIQVRLLGGRRRGLDARRARRSRGERQESAQIGARGPGVGGRRIGVG